MNMEDILQQWDNYQAKEKKKQEEIKHNSVSHKKANAGPRKEDIIEIQNSREINIMEKWLRQHGTIDKDKLAEENIEKNKIQDRNYVLNMKPEAVIDLHGLHQDEAEYKLNAFVTECKRRGLRKILIIHGKGLHTTGTDPVLGELVRKFIEYDKRCGTSGHPKSKQEGGSGATWVILK